MGDCSDQLAILIPVLKRPHRVQPVLDSIRLATPKARVLFIADGDDPPECAALMRSGAEFFTMHRANYAQKINEAVSRTTEPLILFGADDLNFHRGWYEAAKSYLKGDVAVVATNDLCNQRVMGGELATHPLVTREYAQGETIDGSPGPLHVAYPHEYVDREFSEVARARGAFAYAPDAIVEHLHPMVGKAPMDDLYREMTARMIRGRRIYARRRRRWMSQLR